MRAIFLNSWQGNAGKPFFDFIKSESSKTDIFCFQEVSPNFLEELTTFLPDNISFYKAGRTLAIDNQIYGQVIFVRKGIDSEKTGRVNIYYQLKDDIGFLLYLQLKLGGRSLWLGNVHGKTKPGNKLDTDTRLKQSATIINFFKDKEGSKIIGGDFNLMPGTKSVAMFEEAGYRNLIKDFGIKNTRNELSWKQFNNVQHFADYVFVSRDVKINKFEVPYMEISDHLPLILDFEV